MCRCLTVGKVGHFPHIYFINVATEEEVTVGIFNLKTDPNQCCFWLKRTFTDLPEQRMDDPAVACFTDIVAGKRGPEFDLEAAKTLNHLREARMPAKYIGSVETA